MEWDGWEWEVKGTADLNGLELEQDGLFGISRLIVKIYTILNVPLRYNDFVYLSDPYRQSVCLYNTAHFSTQRSNTFV
jgi:hypothetical protein